MKFLFPALCWAVLVGCAKHPATHPSSPPAPRGEVFQEEAPKIDPEEVILPFDDDPEPKGPLYFDFNSSGLKEHAKAASLADYMAKNPTKIVDLAGHCSQEGTEEYNLALGARRAQAVRAYLEAYGIPEYRINWKSFGKEVPVTEDPAHYALNRRVEFFLEDSK